MIRTIILMMLGAALSTNCSPKAAPNTEQASQVSTPAPVEDELPGQDVLLEEVERIAKSARGRVGAAVLLVETNQSIVALNAKERYTMQSVYKLPIGMALLSRVDEGALRLEEQVRVEPSDFISRGQHSPLRDRNPRGVEVSVKELLRLAIAESDGTASDVLMRLAGGPVFVMKYLRELGVNGVNVVNTEKELGEDHSLQYQNWATPESMIVLLRALAEGHGLSARSRELLLKLMTESVPGPKRLKGSLPAGTPVAHKTGSSGTENGMAAATNDVGLITLPGGRHLAIAVFVSDSPADDALREGVIARIARAAWDWSTKAR
jgi:beta-lactamase class A